MHDQCYDFVKRSLDGQDFHSRRVLEIGSKNVNGSVKPLFEGADYFGIDLLDGKDVDLVADAKDFDGKESFDYVVSTEALEHTPYPEEVIECAYRSLKSEGVFIVTAASTGREPHRADGEIGDPIENGEFYQNISPDNLATMLRVAGFVLSGVEQVGTDVRGTAVKP